MSGRSPPRGLLERVRLFMESQGVSPSASFLVGLSGGSDSMALLSLLREVTETAGGHLQACYVDHSLREPTSLKRERAFVELQAARLAVSLHVCQLNSREMQRWRRLWGVEAAARQGRYQALEEIRKRHQLNFIAVGHTRNDQEETLTMRFFQGSGFGGLSGIPPRRDFLIRPLLETDREELRSYLATCGLPYVDDPTNDSDVHLRNKIRHQLLPLVKEIFPGYRKSLQAGAEKMSLLEHHLKRELPQWRKHSPNTYRLASDIFWNLSPLLRMETLLNLHNHLLPQREGDPLQPRVPYRFFKSLTGTPQKPLAPLVGHGVRIFEKESSIWFELDVPLLQRGFSYTVSGEDNFRIGDILIKIKQANFPEKGWDHFYCKNSQAILLRSRKEGDTILTKEGHKSLKKLFSDWKLPSSLQDEVPLLAQGSVVLAVLGSFLGYPLLKGVDESDQESCISFTFSPIGTKELRSYV